MAKPEIVNVSFQKIFDACMKMGCEKLSLTKRTKEGRLHITIIPQGNDKKTGINIHHDIFTKTRYGHYSKSNDPETKKFMSDLKKKLNI